jgi:BirA family biotin operon repressor/biotin-[acetyl-CoA-carboxylase] ligase
MTLGAPRLHLVSTDSTNERAKLLAQDGAAHGTLVTAGVQTAGRGRQGRSWHAPAGEALLMSLVLHETTDLLPIIAAVAVAETIGPEAMIKWPNDILVDARKVAGILVERRQHEDWTVLGIGVNVAVSAFPAELADSAGSLERSPAAVEPFLDSLLGTMQNVLDAPEPRLLERWGARDVLRGRRITWSGGAGVAAGVDGSARLLVEQPDGEVVSLDAGEVHLES